MSSFLIIILLISTQVLMILLIIQIKRLRKVVQWVGRIVNREEGGGALDDVDVEGAGSEPSEECETEKKRKKDMVIEAIRNRRVAVEEKDLRGIERTLTEFFVKNQNDDYTVNLQSNGYFRLLDLRSIPDTRVVVIGDIHCDYNSLAAVLLKLSVSNYDYFEKAYFVFLGDYLDRGTALFEPLLLLMDLKKILGERMIMLKGNHELLEWDSVKENLKSRVKPHESSDCLNEYCGNNKQFLQGFARFYSTLPIYVYLKTNDRNVLLTHAAVPRDVFLKIIQFDEMTGEIVFSSDTPVQDRLSIRNQIFKDMIWGDPSPYNEKYQVEGRFEFGSKQFEQWTSSNHIDLMFRSHEEVSCGYRGFFNDRLFTVFSTGGVDNDDTHYKGVEPAFVVIQSDRFFVENSYIFYVQKDGKKICLNLFNKQTYTEKQAENYKLDNEFLSNEEMEHRVRHVFKILQGDSLSEGENV